VSAFLDQIDTLGGSPQAQDRAKSASGGFPIGIADRLPAGGEVFIQAEESGNVCAENFLGLVEAQEARFLRFSREQERG
jgi:hypothetical protein